MLKFAGGGSGGNLVDDGPKLEFRFEVCCDVSPENDGSQSNSSRRVYAMATPPTSKRMNPMINKVGIMLFEDS